MDANINTQCTSACGNDYDCPHNDDSETETMDRQEQLDLIRAACIEANPGDTTLRDQNSWQGLQIKRTHGRPIRLADVLEAARKVGYVSTEDWLGVITGVVTRYDLRKDDITEQSDECVAYVCGLLANDKTNDARA